MINDVMLSDHIRYILLPPNFFYINFALALKKR